MSLSHKECNLQQLRQKQLSIGVLENTNTINNTIYYLHQPKSSARDKIASRKKVFHGSCNC